MVLIPTTFSEVAPAPAPDTSSRVQATADTFGAGRARDLANIGAGLERTGEAVVQEGVRQLNDYNRAKVRNAVSDFRISVGETIDKELQKGMHATNSHEIINKRIEELAIEQNAKFDNSAQKELYNANLTNLTPQYSDQALAIQRRAIKQFDEVSSAKENQVNTNEAIKAIRGLVASDIKKQLAPNKSVQPELDTSLETVQPGQRVAYQATQGSFIDRVNEVIAPQLEGIKANTKADNVETAVSAFHNQIIIDLASVSPLRAEMYLEAKKDEIDPRIVAKLTSQLEEPKTEEAAFNQVREWESQGLTVTEMLGSIKKVKDPRTVELMRKMVLARQRENAQAENIDLKNTIKSVNEDIASGKIDKPASIPMDIPAPVREKLVQYLREYRSRNAAPDFKLFFDLREKVEDFYNGATKDSAGNPIVLGSSRTTFESELAKNIETNRLAIGEERYQHLIRKMEIARVGRGTTGGKKNDRIPQAVHSRFNSIFKEFSNSFKKAQGFDSNKLNENEKHLILRTLNDTLNYAETDLKMSYDKDPNLNPSKAFDIIDNAFKKLKDGNLLSQASVHNRRELSAQAENETKAVAIRKNTQTERSTAGIQNAVQYPDYAVFYNPNSSDRIMFDYVGNPIEGERAAFVIKSIRWRKQLENEKALLSSMGSLISGVQKPDPLTPAFVFTPPSPFGLDASPIPAPGHFLEGSRVSSNNKPIFNQRTQRIAQQRVQVRKNIRNLEDNIQHLHNEHRQWVAEGATF